MRSPVFERAYIGVPSGLLLAFCIAAVPLTASGSENTFRASLVDKTNLVVEGNHRFVTIAGLTGFQPTSLHTKAYVETSLHQGEQGTLTFWFSPLEDLDFFSGRGNRLEKDPNAFVYPCISDAYPPNKMAAANFGVFWKPGDPQVLAKFSSGSTWGKMDYMLPPFAMIEKIPLRPGGWYHAVLTWNKNARTIDMFVNGRLMGFNHQASGFGQSGRRLYVGCPMMVVRELTLSDREIPAEEILETYRKQRPASNGAADAEIARLVTPAFGPPSKLSLDGSWKKAYVCDFTRQSDLEGWHFQMDESTRDRFTIKITPEGLLFQTPDEIEKNTRATLWGPRTFEGDQWLQLRFRLESPEGLALVVLCASGMGREDFIADHGLEMTGSMSPIISGTRNYHWEFMRRVNVIRTDVETQAVYKNPWRHLYYGMIPKLEQNRWYDLRLVKIGNRLQGSLDGKIVFEVEDNPNDNNGPAYNFGRIALRHMYSTTIRYRDLVIYERRLYDSASDGKSNR